MVFLLRKFNALMNPLFTIAIIFCFSTMVTDTHAINIPTSPRSKQAIAQVEPRLIAELTAQGFQYGAPIFIRIFKDSSELEVWIKKDTLFQLFRIYPICYYSGTLGPKQKQGDWQSPEGFYFVKPTQLNPNSRFHLAFNLGYPNAYDRAHDRTGDALMVHGNCVSIGCYALTDEKIEEIYALAHAAFSHGQPFFRVHIFPFRLSFEKLQRFQESEWFTFWENLKEGYDLFEKTKHPPNITVKDKRYVFPAE